MENCKNTDTGPVNKRKLVTVRKIDAIDPIEGADMIVVATVEGWKVVVKKGDFNVGDPCVYFEIDSFLPEGNQAWQFLVDKQPKIFEGAKGHKLRTIKLRGQVSQGLVLPLDALDSAAKELIADAAGQDVRNLDLSDALGIKKYEAPLPANLQGRAEGLFPSFIQKTDQERCQNLGRQIFGYETTMVPLDVSPEQVAQSALDSGRVQIIDSIVFSVRDAEADPDAMYEITMKLDGSSMTAYVRGEETGDGSGISGKVGVCSRNLELKISEDNKDNTFVRVLQDTGLDVALAELFKRTGRSIAVQGEVMGPSIQGNREGFTQPTFFVFDIFDIDAHAYFHPRERMEILMLLQQTAPQVNHVPVLHSAVRLQDLGLHNVQDLLAFAEGPSIKHPVREGLVFKRLDGQFSFKAISQKFLLKEAD